MCLYFSLDDISLNTGDNLMLDFLPLEAFKVLDPHNEHEPLWKRSDKLKKRVTFSNSTLTLSNITASDAGTYKVLDHNNKTLITVIVEGERRCQNHGMSRYLKHKVNLL